MAEGVTDVHPFINRTNNIKNIAELRIIPTDKIISGSERTMDSHESDAVRSGASKFFEEYFNEEEICRFITPILAEKNCLTCHDVKLDDPLAVVSIRYSMKEDYAAIDRARFNVILMVLAAIIIVFFCVMFLLKKHIIKDLIISVNEIKKLSTGDVTGNIEIRRDDEIGELTSSIQILQSSLRNHSEAAEQMSKENLDIELKKLSENDILGNAMVGLKENINFLVEGMGKIF